MSKLKTQFGTSLTGDFQENTWTFEMSEQLTLTAGDFAILSKDKHEIALNTVNNLLDNDKDWLESNSYDVARLRMALRTIKNSLQ